MSVRLTLCRFLSGSEYRMLPHSLFPNKRRGRGDDVRWLGDRVRNRCQTSCFVTTSASCTVIRHFYQRTSRLALAKQSNSEQQYCTLIWPASIMPHPFQCIATVATEGGAFLLAACGPKLLSLSAKDGSIVSQWTSDAAVSHQIAWVCPWSAR